MHRGASPVGVAVCAALGLVSAGCLGDTAIVLRVVGDPAMNGTFDRLSFTVLQPDPGGGPPASWLREMSTAVLPYEIAFVPGATIGLGDVSISVTANAGKNIVARGTVGAVLEEGKVVEISLPLQPLGCVDDPYEAVEAIGGTLNPKVGYADLNLCPADEQDTPALYVPLSFDVHLGVSYVEPFGAITASFVCTSFGWEAYAEPPQPAEFASFYWTSTVDSTCRLVVTREPGFEGATVWYAIDYWLYPNVPCIDDPLAGAPETYMVVGLPFDGTVGTTRTSCPGVPDAWMIDAPAGTILGAEVLPADGSDRSSYIVSVVCPETPSMHWSSGGTFARTGPTTGAARTSCLVTVDGGPPNGTFDLRLRAGDYASCVEDYEEANEPVDLRSWGAAYGLTVCRAPGLNTGEMDELYVSDDGSGFPVCIWVEPDPLAGWVESNLRLTVEAASGELAVALSSGGLPQEACVGNFAAPGQVTATIECVGNGPTALTAGCAQVYDVYWY